MVSCKHCTTSNSLDSAFCKRCGRPLSREELEAGRARVQQLLAEAAVHLDHGRTEEAAQIVDGAVLADPSSLRALSMRAMILERRGQFAEALELYDRVLEAEPESPVERVKANQLRNLLALQATPPGPISRKAALVGAAAACLLVVALGALAATLTTGRASKVTVAQGPAAPAYNATPFDVQLRAAEPSVESAGAHGPTGIGQGAGSVAAPDPEPQRAAVPESGLTGDMPPNARLPKPGALGSGGQETRPVNPLPQGLALRPMPEARTETTEAPAPKADADPEPAPSNTEEKPAERQPVVDIRLSQGGAGNGEAAMTPNGVEALVRTARGQYQVGNYQAAATTYERALKAGADEATVNQRLAQCYEQLGRRSDAADAYQRAIQALERAINGGKSSERLRMALDSSRQALKNLQGG